MTNHRAGRSNNRDPRPWRNGKAEKSNTTRYLRRRARALVLALRRGGAE
jgi:hypothetical protein